MAGSNITNSTTTSSMSLSLSAQVGFGILFVAFILGFPGNLFVVWTILCRVQRRSVTCLLVLNLAVADAFVLLSAPLFMRLLVGGKAWEFGAGMCKTVHYLCCVNMYVSIYLICVMSMDRWLAVSSPFLSQRLRNTKNLYIVMLVVWIMSFLMAIPMPFYRSTHPIKTNNSNIELYHCSAHHWGWDGHAVFQYLTETILGFLIPFSFIIFCYISVICRLRSAMFQGRVKGSLLILMIIIAFTLFWLPYHLINILQVIGLLHKSSLLSVAKLARPNVTAFAFMSSSVNPVLYVFAGSSHIRNAGFGFMAKLFDGTNSEHSSTFRRRNSSYTDSSAISRMSLKAFRGGGSRKKSYGEDEDKRVEPSCGEELKTLNTVS